MGISTKEISEVIKERLKDFDASLVSVDVGRIVAVGDGIAQIYGLQNAMAGELLEFPRDTFGLALNLEEDQVRSVILGEFGHLHEGDEVRTTGRLLEVPVGDELLGRIVNPLGVPLDDKGPIKTSKTLPVEKIAPGVITRKRVDSPVQTGIKAIDAMIPIGRGQRELIIGDRFTGKTTSSSTRSSTRKERTSTASTWRSDRTLLRSHAWPRPWKRPGRWSTRSSSPRPRTTPLRCSSSPPTRAARWASTSWTRARKRCAATTT